MNKGILRGVYLEKRLRFSLTDRIKKSREISKKALGLGEIDEKKTFSVYLPVQNEVDTRTIIGALLERTKTILVPAYFKKSNGYHFVKFTNWQDLEKGPRGILQPKDPKIVDPFEIEVAIIPGLAFSKKGIRLGYGKGVFDRLLSKTNALKIGLAYEFQITNDIPREEHDLLMNFVVTEKTIYSIDATAG